MIPTIKRYCAPVLFVLLATPAFSEDTSDVVLSADGNVSITRSDIDSYIIENLPEDKRGAVLNRAGIFKEMAEALYIVRAIAKEAEAQPGFDREQAEWAAHMAYQRKLVEQYRVDYIRKTLGGVDWDSLAKEKYKVESAQFLSEELVKASHILVSTEKRSDDEAKALAADIRERLLKGEDFEELAKELTDDVAGKQNGGGLGYFARGKMVKPFADAAFSMSKVGEISPVVATPFGYHVIRYEGRKLPEPIPYDKVKDKIINQLQIDMGNKVWQDKIIALRSDSSIKIDQAIMDQLTQEYRAVPPEPAQ